LSTLCIIIVFYALKLISNNGNRFSRNIGSYTSRSHTVSVLSANSALKKIKQFVFNPASANTKTVGIVMLLLLLTDQRKCLLNFYFLQMYRQTCCFIRSTFATALMLAPVKFPKVTSNGQF
jgi:hypothetical protein